MRIALTTQQDQIEVQTSPKLIVIRQDRVSAENDNFTFQTSNNIWKVLDYSPFGLAVYTDIPPTSDIFEGRLVVQNVDLGILELKKIRVDEYFYESKHGYKVGFSITGNPISMERSRAVIETNKIIAEHISLFSDNSVPESFRLITYEVRNWLSSLQDKVNILEKTTFDQGSITLNAYEDVVSGLVARYIEENISPLYVKLESIVKGLDTKTVKKCFRFFRDSCGQYMFQSSYANRAFNKPRGYAGDFEMMKTIYNHENRGATLFGRCMERYFIDVPESQAVRNRGRYLMGKILQTVGNAKSPIKILSLACGPAMEVQYFLAEHPQLANENIEFHFADQDTDALKECQRKIESLVREKKLKVKTVFHNWAIKNIIESGLQTTDFDLIYSAGLFDYLSDAVAHFAGKQLCAALKSGGHAIIGNFDISAPNRFGLSMVTDWHLIYRSEEDLRRLFSELGKITMERESLGINLFAVLEKR